MSSTTSNMPVATSNMQVSTSVPGKKSNNIYSEYAKASENYNNSVGLGFGVFFNSNLILFIFIILIFNIFSREFKRFPQIMDVIIWVSIGFIILIGIGLAEYLTSNKYKDSENWEKVLKVFSYINFTLAGMLFLFLIINIIYLINNKKTLLLVEEMDIKLKTVLEDNNNLLGEHITKKYKNIADIKLINANVDKLSDNEKLTKMLDELKLEYKIGFGRVIKPSGKKILNDIDLFELNIKHIDTYINKYLLKNNIRTILLDNKIDDIQI